MPRRKKAVKPRTVPVDSSIVRYRTFKRWLRGVRVIKDAVYDLGHKRQIYREVTAIIDGNPKLHVPSAFYDWLHCAYITDVTMGIRRLVDWDKRTISFVRLMQDIEHHPEVISRRRFVSKYDHFLKKYGHRDFEKFSKPGDEFINPSIVRRHRRELVMSQRKLRDFVNRHIAHTSKAKMRKLPTYKELDACVDLLGNLLKKYTLLIEQAALIHVVPEIQYDWKAPFRVPWISNAAEGSYEEIV
jgi:hypothetical protein